MSHDAKPSYITSVFGLIALFGIAMSFIALPLKQLTHSAQPLADPASLKLLIAGKPLPQTHRRNTSNFS